MEIGIKTILVAAGILALISVIMNGVNGLSGAVDRLTSFLLVVVILYVSLWTFRFIRNRAKNRKTTATKPTKWEEIPYEKLPEDIHELSEEAGEPEPDSVEFYKGEKYNYQIKYEVEDNKLQPYCWRKKRSVGRIGNSNLTLGIVVFAAIILVIYVTTFPPSLVKVPDFPDIQKEAVVVSPPSLPDIKLVKDQNPVTDAVSNAQTDIGTKVSSVKEWVSNNPITIESVCNTIVGKARSTAGEIIKNDATLTRYVNGAKEELKEITDALVKAQTDIQKELH